MKRFLTLFATALLLTAALYVSASAASFNDAAEDLAAIGMLQGDSSGFALDRAPTRSEAAIMLVRLFGAEDEAQAAYASGGLSHSFTDVSDFAAPYVAWLTVRGIANGTSATTFGAANPCSGQMYAAFLLRALGYQDGADFEYADAQAFAMTRGITDLSAGGTFLRDHLAAMTVQALGADLKDGSTYLLDSLIHSGAVDAAAAKPLANKIEAYRQLTDAVLTATSGSLDANFSMKASFSYGIEGQDAESADGSMSMSGSGSFKIIQDPDDLQMAMTLRLQTEGETVSGGLWVKDGVMYVRSGSDAYQTPLPGMAELYQASAVSGSANGVLLPFLDSASVKSSGGSSVYTLALNDALANALKDVVPLIFGAGGTGFDASMNGSGFTYTFGPNGKLQDASAALKLTAAMTSGPNAAAPMNLTVTLSMDVDLDVQDSGKNVSITFPDFSGFRKAA